MAYICDKKIKCSECFHYRYDEDYGSKCCFAKLDLEQKSKTTKNWNSNNESIKCKNH